MNINLGSCFLGHLVIFTNCDVFILKKNMSFALRNNNSWQSSIQVQVHFHPGHKRLSNRFLEPIPIDLEAM